MVGTARQRNIPAVSCQFKARGRPSPGFPDPVFDTVPPTMTRLTRPSRTRSGKTWVVVLVALAALAAGLVLGPAAQRMIGAGQSTTDSNTGPGSTPDRVTAL